jgi:cbb3-type cytochrome c oxidase subunit III
MRGGPSIAALWACLFSGAGVAAAPDGATLFQACRACHGSNGEGIVATGAPAIAGAEAWYVTRQLRNFASGARGSDPSDAPAAQMRAIALTLANDEQRTAVAAYVATLPRIAPKPGPPGDATNGRNYYNAICSACHGGNGLGNESLGAPRLAGQSTSYLARQFGLFKSGRRGASKDDRPGAQMRAAAALLPDARTERDVLSFAAGIKP